MIFSISSYQNARRSSSWTTFGNKLTCPPLDKLPAVLGEVARPERYVVHADRIANVNGMVHLKVRQVSQSRRSDVVTIQRNRRPLAANTGSSMPKTGA